MTLQRCLARRLGIPDEAPVPSFLKVFRAEGVSKAFEHWEPPGEAASSTLVRFDLTSPLVKVRLSLPRAPFATTGTWAAPAEGAAEGAVSWDLDDSDVAPRYAIASWALPNEAEQTLRLGRVLLRGERLGDFARWEQALEPDERRAWLEAVAAKDRTTSVVHWLERLTLPGPKGADLLEDLRTILTNVPDEEADER